MTWHEHVFATAIELNRLEAGESEYTAEGCWIKRKAGSKYDFPSYVNVLNEWYTWSTDSTCEWKMIGKLNDPAVVIARRILWELQRDGMEV